MNKKRIEWIDCAKGFAVLLVLLGHILIRTGQGKWESKLCYIIYTFHMPLFFMLSGITFSVQKNFIQFIKEKVTRLLIPTVLFSLGMVISQLFCFYIMGTFNSQSISEYLQKICNNVIPTILMTPHSEFSQYWFLPVLFSAEVILYILLTKIKNRLVVTFILIILIVVNRILYVSKIVLPFGLCESFIAIPFIVCGMLIHKYSRMIKGCPTVLLCSGGYGY